MGGNGTMAAGRVLSAHAAQCHVPLRIVGVPKTIDNDIPHTDVCPGFASAARFLVAAVADIGADAASMRGYEDVVLIETMGRHAGWLAVATALARKRPDDVPHVVLVPEEPFDEPGFLAMVREQHGRRGTCVVTVAEGVRDASGILLAESSSDAPVERDASGQVIFGRSAGPSPYLAGLIRQRLGLQCRVVRPDVLQRCSRAHVSHTDRTLAALVGTAAVDAALAAEAGHAEMIALRLVDDAWTTGVVPLEQVHGERTVPEAIRRNPEPLRTLLLA
jgi:6-phosphofructokinase 1